MKFRVGKKQGNTVIPAFDIEQIEGGGVRFSNVHSLTDAERHHILAHYGRVFRAKYVVTGAQHFRNLKPGTAAHFEHASYQLPAPFQLLKA